MQTSSLAAAAAALVLIVGAHSAAPAPISGTATPGAPAPIARSLTREDLEGWLDGFMPYALKRGDVAGAIVVVVKDGQVLLEKGYGYADVAARRPVDPETTLFRPGSISKLVTWTAVMQQAEAGRIDLDRDVNGYLDFQIPPFHGRPITMRNLMTHTAGFEDALKDLLCTDPKGPPPLSAFLKRHLPARVFPPGEIPAYSNYGASLAGYIVQRVSGEDFDAYAERHIFAPLGMRHSSFRQPLPASLRPQMASGYRAASEPAKPYEMTGLAPAGSLAASGADMARFMIAHLQDGEYNGVRILEPATARMMHDTPLTIISPQVDRMLLGFYEMNLNGRRVIGHGGDTRLFHSVLQLYPDDHVGLYVSLNSEGRDAAADAIRAGLSDGFADRYFPAAPTQTGVSQAQARADASAMAGGYLSSRRSVTSFLSLLDLVSQAKVTADGAGHIVASPVIGLNGQPETFEETAPQLWREVGGKERIAARMAGGKVTLWSDDDDSPYLVYTPAPAWRDAAWLTPAAAASVAILLLAVALWPASALVQRICGAGSPLHASAARHQRVARLAAAAAGLLMALWLGTVGWMLTTFTVGSALDPWILTLHVLSIVVFPLAAVVLIWNAWTVWATRRGWRSAFARCWATLLAAASLILLWTALVFHLIGLGLAF